MKNYPKKVRKILHSIISDMAKNSQTIFCTNLQKQQPVLRHIAIIGYLQLTDLTFRFLLTPQIPKHIFRLHQRDGR